jgi:hypothetical protein
MGQLLYGSPPASFELEDRTLAHVEIVTLAKLRRNESFALSLDLPDGGRATIWIGTNSILQFRFVGPRHEINRAWLEELIDSANTAAGMRIVPETGTTATEPA